MKSCDNLKAMSLEEMLLAEIAADPTDDRPRLVYADVLQQRGDPWGDLIALQLADREPERVAELIRIHAMAHLGPLGLVVDLARCTFERGFLVEVRLGDGKLAELDAAVGHRLWATVRKLHLGVLHQVREEIPRELLLHPVMRFLEVVMLNDGGCTRWLSRFERDGTSSIGIGGVGARPRRWRAPFRP